MKILIPIRGCYLFFMHVAVVYVDVHFFIGLDVMDKISLKVYVAERTLKSD